ncbi:hypothetical protein OGAPHI_007119 [Ogataea philodendri]|uniref:Uncharacterized protein n=1 Tax=Ogataea philodendri TaxID=1378263 RepID=A0A9P8NUE4_9ASCO|nr:uncharacterized protein OGAPHI_007119 [Ogataea philodendri]KAH3660533.1 hypothetical protein OGAPHI_007119 [Ogataea philodendri]
MGVSESPNQPSGSPTRLRQQRFSVSPRHERSSTAGGGAREVSFGGGDDLDGDSSDEDLFNMRKRRRNATRAPTKAVKQKGPVSAANSITSLLSNTMNLRSKDKLSSLLGFDLDSALKVDKLTEQHANLMALRQEEDVIDRLAQQKMDDLSKREQDKTRIDKMITERVDPHQEGYVEYLRKELVNGDISKLEDVYFLDSVGSYGQSEPDLSSLQQDALLGHNWFPVRTILTDTDIHSFIQVSSRYVWDLLHSDLANSYALNSEKVNDFLTQNGMVDRPVEYMLASKKSLPAAPEQVLKLYCLVELARASDNTETRTGFDRLLRATVLLMVDARVNEGNVDDYIVLGRETVSSLQLLNKTLVSLAQWFHELSTKPRPETFAGWCTEVSRMVAEQFGNRLVLVHRLISNITAVSVPMLKSLKLWLVVWTLLVNDQYDESKHDKDQLLRLKSSLLTYSLDPDQVVSSVYHFARYFSQCSLASPASPELSAHLLAHAHTRIRLFQMAIFMTIGTMKKSEINRNLQFPASHDSYYSKHHYEKLHIDLSGVPENEYLLHHMKFYINLVKNRYFRNYHNAILPLVTECIAILTNVLSRIERELTMPEIFSD